MTIDHSGAHRDGERRIKTNIKLASQMSRSTHVGKEGSSCSASPCRDRCRMSHGKLPVEVTGQTRRRRAGSSCGISPSPEELLAPRPTRVGKEGSSCSLNPSRGLVRARTDLIGRSRERSGRGVVREVDGRDGVRREIDADRRAVGRQRALKIAVGRAGGVDGQKISGRGVGRSTLPSSRRAPKGAL